MLTSQKCMEVHLLCGSATRLVPNMFVFSALRASVEYEAVFLLTQIRRGHSFRKGAKIQFRAMFKTSFYQMSI